MSNEKKNYDLLSIGAHPDDVEVGTGGVLIDLAKRDYKCGVVIMTEGEMGTGGDREIRAREVRDAAEILGVDVLKVFDWGDTRLEDSYDYRLQIAQIIRDTRPKIILTPYPHVGHGRRQSHPDHVACGIITLNAVNLAALKKADLTGEKHRVTRVFHYFLPPQVYPNFVVDITPHFDQWIKALSAHESQFLNPEKSRDYIDSITSMVRTFGQMAGVRYGQGFQAVEPIVVGDIMSLAEYDQHDDPAR